MARPPRLLVPVLLTLFGCSGSRGCGASEPEVLAPSAPSLAPSAAPPDAGVARPVSLPAEARYARQWLVIVSSSATPGEGGEVLTALKKTGLSVAPLRLSTNAFRELRPCLEILVARAFEDKAAAVSLQQRLIAAGVESYVRNAGPLEPDREGREAACREGSEALAVRVEGLRQRGAPRIVESHEGRTFLLLGESRESRALEPVDARREVWMAPVAVDPTGLFVRGDKVDLYGEAGPLRAGCTVKGFAWINRGRPSDDYFRRNPLPEAPGCGRAWVFAELDCEVAPDTRVFALPAGAPAPLFFTPREDVAPEVRRAQWEALRRSPRFIALRAEGAAQAEQVQEELSEEVRSLRYTAAERQAVFTVARLRTGEGNAACGTDYEQQVTRAVVLEPDGTERVLPLKQLDGDDVVAVLDLEGDGKVELLLHASWPADTVRLVREDGTEVAGAVVENCDDGC